jgi:predicted small integral membrane protein
MGLLAYLKNLKRDVFAQNVRGNYKQTLSIRVIIIFIVLGLTNLLFGVFLTILYSRLYEVTIPYENGENAYTFQVYSHTKKPIFFYLQLKDFYQTHEFYAKSRSDKQLEGEPTEEIDSCAPLERTDGRIIYPCGIISNTFVQDKFTLYRGNERIPISTENISWKSERKKVNVTSYSLDEIVSPPLWSPYEEVPDLSTNFRFINWMMRAPFPTFRKLYGRIEDGFEAGEYVLHVDSFFPYGIKSVVFAQSSWAGSKNYFLAILMIIVGFILCAVSPILYLKRRSITDSSS